MRRLNIEIPFVPVAIVAISLIVGTTMYFGFDKSIERNQTKSATVEGCVPTGKMYIQRKSEPLVEVECDPEQVKKYLKVIL